jgi:hypothetical protein
MPSFRRSIFERLAFLLFLMVIGDTSIAQEISSRRLKLASAAERAAPTLARYVCVRAIKHELIKRHWKHPKTLWNELQRIKNLEILFAPQKFTLSHKTKKELGLMTSPIVMGESFYYNTFGQSLREGIATLIFFDPVEASTLKSFYVDRIINSDQFAEQMEICSDYFSFPTEDILNKIRIRTKWLNHLGYSAGVTLTLGVGGLSLGWLKWLPGKMQKIVMAAAGGVGIYFLYDGIKPYLNPISQIGNSDTILGKVNVDYGNPSDWPYIYNLCLDLYHASKIGSHDRTTEQSIANIRNELMTYKTFVENAERYLTEKINRNEIAPEQIALKSLLSFVLTDISSNTIPKRSD